MQDERSEVAYQAVIFRPSTEFREKFIGGYGYEHKPCFVRCRQARARLFRLRQQPARGHFLKSASSPACTIASSISDFAPLAAMPPIVLPSTLMGNPPW